MQNRFERSFGRAKNNALSAITIVGLVFGAGAAFANNANSDEITVASTGTGSYVCSPAGFGRKSRCYSR